MSMSILAIDQGTRTGFALLEGGRRESGTVVFDVKRGESPGCRYIRLNRWLDEFAGRVQLVVYEQTHNRGGAATETAAGFATRIQEFCARHGIEHAAVHSATLKKFATGKGNADKSVMLSKARERWPAVADDNEADALWLLLYAVINIAGGQDL